MTTSLDNGRYELTERLGCGPRGEVHLAHDRELERWVAVKILHRRLAANRHATAAFLTGTRAASRVNHPAVVAVYDAGWTVDGLPFAVTEWVRGHDLGTELAERGPVDERRAETMARRLTAALQAAHERWVVHGDVRAANVLLAGDGRVLLSDFALSSHPRDDPHQDFVALADTMTRARGGGAAAAAPAAMAPTVQTRAIAVRSVPRRGPLGHELEPTRVLPSPRTTSRPAAPPPVPLRPRSRRPRHTAEKLLALAALVAAVAAFAPTLLVSDSSTVPRKATGRDAGPRVTGGDDSGSGRGATDQRPDRSSVPDAGQSLVPPVEERLPAPAPRPPGGPGLAATPGPDSAADAAGDDLYLPPGSATPDPHAPADAAADEVPAAPPGSPPPPRDGGPALRPRRRPAGPSAGA